MEVRLLSPDAAAAYLALRLRGLLEDPRAFGRAYDEERAEPLERVEERLRASADKFTLGAFEAGELVGLMTCVRQDLRKTRHKASVFGVYVAPEGRGRGVGRALLAEVIARARTMPGVEQLTLTVSTTQIAARHLYASAGFVEFGLEPRALKVDGEDVDEAHLWLDLTKG